MKTTSLDHTLLNEEKDETSMKPKPKTVKLISYKTTPEKLK